MLDDYCDTADKLGDELYIINEYNTNQYIKWDYCVKQYKKMFDPHLGGIFLTKKDFDQRKILTFLYDCTINNIIMKETPQFTVRSTLRLTHNTCEQNVKLSFLFEDMSVNESLLTKFISSLSNMKQNILQEVQYKTFDLKSHILNIPDIVDIDYNITSKTIEVIVLFTIEIWPVKKILCRR